MIEIRRASIVLFFCLIAGCLTADPWSAKAQHAPPIHSVPFHPPVVHAPPVHITPLHVEPVHVAPIHSEPVHAAPVHSDALSSHMTTHLSQAPHASATTYHAVSPARSASSVGMGSLSHHGSGGSGDGGGRSGGMGGGGKSPSYTQTFNRASATNVTHSSATSTTFRAHSPSTGPSGRGRGLEYRGTRTVQADRTMQGQVSKAVEKAGGNPTAVRNGQDLARFRTGRHGMETANVTPQNVRNVNPEGKARLQPGPDRLVNKSDMKELYKAQSKQPGSGLRTRNGKPVKY